MLQRLIFLCALLLKRAAVLLAATVVSARAESPYLIDVWTPYEGLPQSRVLSIAQTQDGYLWIGTQRGWLARFDGIHFKPYSSDNTPALGSPEVQKLIVDEAGVLWISDVDGRLVTYSKGKFQVKVVNKANAPKRVVELLGNHGGVSRFVTQSRALLSVDDSKVTYENENNLSQPPGKLISQFCQAADGVIWCVNGKRSLGKWVNGAFQVAPEVASLGSAKVFGIYLGREQEMLAATDSGLWKLENGMFAKVPLAFPEAKPQVYQLASNHDGSLWLRTQDGVSLVRGDEIIRSLPLPGISAQPDYRPMEMHSDSSGGVWILKYGSGVWHVNEDGVVTVLSSQSGLPSDLVESWFEDREKNIWLGTASGLVRIRPRWFQIVDTKSSGPGSEVVSLCEDATNGMWFGRDGGLTHWHDGILENVVFPPTNRRFPISSVTVLPGTDPDELWLGTVQSGAMLLRNGVIEQPSFITRDQPGPAIRVMRKDHEGGVWFGGEYGLFRWDGKVMRQFGPDDGLSPGHIFDISCDSKGQVWVAKADAQLVVFRNDRFENVPMPGIPPNLRIYSVLCGAGDNIWLGTVGAGLLHLSQGRIFQYTTVDGLPGDAVSQLLEDDYGHLWGGTQQGIFRVSTTALDMRSKGVEQPFMFQTYDHSDGLPSAECSGGFQPACWKTRDGRLWFSTTSGAVAVDPAQVKKNIAPPNVVIEEMRVNEKVLGTDGDSNSDGKGDVEPGRHRFEFHFTGLSLTAPEKVRFQWHLRGVDNDWVDGRSQRSVAYSGLAPGNYQFSVRACNNDGVWSRTPAMVSFAVKPFFWQRRVVQLGFFIFGSALITLLIAAFIKRQHAREIQQFEYERGLEQQRFRHKQAMENERSRIAAELHDDLGANLTQIQWLGDAAVSSEDPRPGDAELLSRISRISRKSREMVRLIDEIVWAVNPKNDTLEQLVTYVCNFAEQYFRDSPTRARIDVTGTIPAHRLEADVRHHLFLIAKEALHNVAKHGATDRVWVRITIEDGIFKLLVEDHGQGFDLSAADEGDGLANMRRRAQQAGVDLQIESTPGAGTRITLFLDIKTPTP